MGWGAEERAPLSPLPGPHVALGSALTAALPTPAALKPPEPDRAARASCAPRPSGCVGAGE